MTSIIVMHQWWHGCMMKFLGLFWLVEEESSQHPRWLGSGRQTSAPQWNCWGELIYPHRLQTGFPQRTRIMDELTEKFLNQTGESAAITPEQKKWRHEAMCGYDTEEETWQTHKAWHTHTAPTPPSTTFRGPEQSAKKTRFSGGKNIILNVF